MPNGVAFIDPSTPAPSPVTAPPTAPQPGAGNGYAFIDANTPSPSAQPSGQPSPQSAQDIAASLHSPDSNDLLNSTQAAILFNAEKQKSFGQQIGEFGKAALEGFKSVAGNIFGGVKEAATNNPLQSAASLLLQGPVQGTAQDVELGRMLSRAAFDKVRDLGADDATKIEHFRQRYNESLISQRALTRGNNSNGTLVDMGFKPLPNLAASGSMLLDPITIATMGGGKALQAPFAAAARGLAEHFPTAARAAEFVKTIPGKAVQAGLSGAESLGSKVAEVSVKPGEAVENVLHGVGGFTGGVIGAKAAEHVPLLGQALGTLAGAAGAGKLVEQTAGFLRRLGETSGDQIRSRLLQLAQDPETPAWMKVAAGKLDDWKVGNAAQFVSDMGESAAHGAAMGAGMAAIGAENPEEAGGLTGGGAALGAYGRGLRKLTGADSAARRVLADVGAKQRFLERITSPVEKGGSGLSVDEAAKGIDDTTATVAGHAADLLGDSVNWRVLRPGEEIPGGEPGAAASYDPVTRTINFRLGDNSERHLHEIAHAVEQASGAPGEARLQIDSIFSPDQLRGLAAQYASRLAGSQDPAVVAGKMQQLSDAWKGDQWLYNEIYAEAGYGAFKRSGSSMQRLLGVNRSIWGQLGDAARGTFLNHILPDAFAQDGAPTLPRGAIFNDPAIYGNSELRKLVVQHLNAIRQHGVSALSSKGDVNTVSMPERLLGNHPKAPKQMLMENGLALENARGELRRTTRGEERKSDKAKAQQTAQVLATEPVRPKGDTTPDVAPRVNSDGKTEVTGTKITDLLSKIPGYGPFARGVAAAAEKLMGTGEAFKAGYFAIGTSEGTGDWRKSVAKNSGDMPWQEIHLAPFEFKIDGKQHALVTGLSITAADRKIARWAQEGRLDDYWNGDAQAFRRDLFTYLENHKDNRPGSDKIGDHKRDLLNLFTVGKLNPKEANPLRAAASAKDRGGIIRSLRLDRISSMDKSDQTGWHAEYPKKKINFSPEADTEKEQLIRDRIAAGMTPRDLRYTVNKDPNFPGWGFVQVDDPRDNNAFSSNPDQLSRLGMAMPGTTKELLDRLPTGRFSLDQVVSHLSGKEKQPVLFSPPVDKEDKTGVWYSRLETGLRSLPAGDKKPKSGQQWKGWIARMSQGQSIPTQGKETYRGGIAQEEIKWSGLEDALKDGGKYTKAQVLDLLSKNAVQVQDVVSSGEGVAVPDFEHAYHDTQDMDEGQTYHSWNDGDYEIATIVNDDEDPKKSDEYVINFTDPATDRGQGGRDIAKAYSWKDAVSEAEDHAASYNRDKGGGKYADYRAMPGGENYRELLLTLPERSAPPIPHPEVLTELPAGYEYIHDQKGEPDKQWGIIPPNQNHARPKDGRWFKSKEDALYYTLADMNRQAEDKYKREVRLANEAYNFDSQHWDEPNVLAHVRFDERKGPGGEKILFLQELQSDWHQQGRERGYRAGLLNEENPLREKHIARLQEIAKEVDNKFSPEQHKFGTPEEQAAARKRLYETRDLMVRTATTDPNYEKVVADFKDAEASMRSITPGWGVAEGGREEYAKIWPLELAGILERNVKMRILPAEEVKPLAEEARRLTAEINFIDEGRARKNKMVPDAPFKHSWPEMAMRRMIKWAADHGFAKIAWTTGKQQSELYGLSNQIDQLHAFRNPDGTYSLVGEKNGQKVTNPGNIPEDKLSEYVGQDLAAQIIADKYDSQTYKGRQLEMDSPGMKGFYDRILPITAAKLARKYGGQVGTMAISGGRGEIARFSTRKEAAAWAKENLGDHDFDITTNGGAWRVYDKFTHEEARLEEPARVHALALFNPKGLDDIRRQGVPLFSPEVKDEEPRDPFYSQLRRVVDEKFTGKQMPAAQLAAILRNPQNGVKADEMKWSGLDDYLRGKSRVTREEVQNFVNQNQLQVKEIERGAPFTPAKLPAFTIRSGDLQWEAVDSQGRRIGEVGKGVVGSEQEAEDYLRRYLKSKYEEKGREEAIRRTVKYDKFQLPGGENYRELLFTLPRAGQARAVVHPEFPDKFAVMLPNGDYVRNPDAQGQTRPGEVTTWTSLETAQKIGVPYYDKQVFKSNHWDEPNVLAHVRYNDRVDQEGKPVKFIEELQSDWHQKGRKEGYRAPGLPSWATVARDPNAPEHRRWVVTHSNGEQIGAGETREGAIRNLDQFRPEVPDAPLKNTWHETVFRRMVALAAEQGADKLAWGTGEMQADRYNLAKQIDQIQYRKHPDGTVSFSVWKDGKSLDKFERMDSSIDEAEKLFGKDIAKRMEQGEGRELSQSAHDDIVKRGSVTDIFHSPAHGGGWFARFKDGSEMGRWISQEDVEKFRDQIDKMIKDEPQRVLEGDGLKVGGAGMKGFYDKILVDYANKFGKKFGSRVRDIYLKPSGEAKTLANDNAEHAAAIGAAPVHALDITPEMRKTATQGVPLFSPDVKGEYWINDNGVDFADGDVGDMNHESYAVQHAARRILDLFHADTDEEFYDEDIFRNAIIDALNEDNEEGKADKSNWTKLAEDYIKANVPADKLGQTLDEFETAQGKGDARDTAVKHWGWVWVRGNDASTWTLTKDDMKNIADGYSEIADQEGLGEDDPEFNLDDMEISIHVASTGRRVNMTLAELESGRTPSKDPTWPGQFSPKVDQGWEKDFPRVVVQTTTQRMKADPDYKAAKAGDRAAALRLARVLVRPEKFQALAEKYPDAILVPARAEEAGGRNKIPAMFAKVLGKAWGWEVDKDIVQTGRVFHTGASAAERLGRVPEFDGTIKKGQAYILLDDVVTSGSTFAGLRRYIQENGGRVVAAGALGTARPHAQLGYSGDLAILPETVAALKRRFDIPQLERLLSSYGVATRINQLTNGQGRYLALFRSLDSIRDRLSEAGIRPG